MRLVTSHTDVVSSLVTNEAQDSLVLFFNPNVPDGICAFFVAKDMK